MRTLEHSFYLYIQTSLSARVQLNVYEITEQPAKSMKNKMFTALCMVAAGLLEDGSSTMYVAAANPLEEAASSWEIEPK